MKLDPLTPTFFALLLGSVRSASLFWTDDLVVCQTFDSNTKACGVVSERICVICSGMDEIPFTGMAGSDTPSAAAIGSSDQPAFSDVPSPSISDSPTSGIGATKRSVEYSFVPHYLEGRQYRYDEWSDDTYSLEDPEPVNIVKVSLSYTNDCEITIDGDVCSSCTYCGDYKYTADCTNIPHGRQTFCESAEVDDNRNELVGLFFPLTASSPAALASGPGPGPTSAPTSSKEDTTPSTPSSVPSVAPSILPSSAPSVVPTPAPSTSPSSQPASVDPKEDCVPCTDSPPHWFPDNYSCGGSDWRGYVRNNCWRNKWRRNDWCTYSCATKWNKIEVKCCSSTSSTTGFPTGSPTTATPTITLTKIPTSAPTFSDSVSPVSLKTSPIPLAAPSTLPSPSPSVQPSVAPRSGLEEECVHCTDTPPHWFPDHYSCGGSDWRGYVRNNCWRNKWRGNDWCTYSCATKWNKIDEKCCSSTPSTGSGIRNLRHSNTQSN